MKFTHYQIILTLVFCAFTSCKTSNPQASGTSTTTSPKPQKETLYTCPMHPQIRQDHPGQCPICGMNLVPVEDVSHDESSSETSPDTHAGFKLSAERRQMIGVKSKSVERKIVFKTIEASGRVAFDPELFTAQQEYFEALKQQQLVRQSPVSEAKQSANQMVNAARMRLRVLGLSEPEIDRLSKKGPNSLLATQAGEDSWIYAEVYEMDLPYVKPGLEAEIFGSAFEGDSLKGKIVSVDRVLNPTTRTAKVRILVKDLHTKLRPETYVNVSIQSPLGEQIVVPFDAVFDTGKQAWVFVTDGEGSFEPRKISIKFRANDDVAIAHGLKEGEKIVTSANFLIDSESRLKGVQKGL